MIWNATWAWFQGSGKDPRGEKRRGGCRGLPVKRCWMEGDGGTLLKDYSTENGLLTRNLHYLSPFNAHRRTFPSLLESPLQPNLPPCETQMAFAFKIHFKFNFQFCSWQESYRFFHLQAKCISCFANLCMYARLVRLIKFFFLKKEHCAANTVSTMEYGKKRYLCHWNTRSCTRSAIMTLN